MEALGVELMDTGGDVGELSLVLEETEMEVVKTQEPAKKSHKEGKETKGKKRVPLVTLSNGGGANKQSSSASGMSYNIFKKWGSLVTYSFCVRRSRGDS